MKQLIIGLLIATTLSTSALASDKKYLELLAAEAQAAGLKISDKARSCAIHVIGSIPQTVKTKAAEIHSIDAVALQNAGVPPEDIRTAIDVSRPCRNQVALDNR